jgi:N-acetylglucosaminyldiphosphoundecaprenol N-acetyl-beta-D-mannosaminyltransferase
MKPEELILGYSITTKSGEECIFSIKEWVNAGKGNKYFVCANPHSLEVAGADGIFSEAIRNADLVIPDGIGIVIASRILGGNICRRVTGNDIFIGLSSALNEEKGFSYFFLGSTEATLLKIRDRMRADFRDIGIAGTYSPPFESEFGEEDSRLMIKAINEAQPDVLWVGMTAPKQEKWIYEHRDALSVRCIGAIGAVFDFYAGNVKRSHPVFQRVGMEWLPRLLREPRRLWRRNFISNPRFILRVLHSKFRCRASS